MTTPSGSTRTLQASEILWHRTPSGAVGASVVLVGIGFVQVYRRKSCERRNPATLAILWISAAIIAIVFLFPQAIASAIATVLPS